MSHSSAPTISAPPSRFAHALQQFEAKPRATKSHTLARIHPNRSTSVRLRQQCRWSATRAPVPTQTSSLTHRHRSQQGTVPEEEQHRALSDVKLLARLEKENASLPQQDSVGFILAHTVRQNAMLDNDPKSVCIRSNELEAHLSTLQAQMESSTLNDDVDWEFWSALVNDFGATALKLPQLVSAKLKAGIPPPVRGVVWQAMSQSASLHLETMYGQLVEEPSAYERIIQRDLARTFPHIDMFKQEGGDGQRSLERILKAYSLYDAHVGYCQGLAFLVGPLLMNMPEQQAFCVFVRLMETYELRTMFTLNMEGLELRLFQFTCLLAQILPDLANHLVDHGVHSQMFASQWFLTLFAYAFPIALVFRIYDIVFAEGAPETIMRVAIAMLKRSEADLLALDEFEDIMEHLTSKLYLAYHDDATAVISDAMALSNQITREKLDELTHLYLCEVEEDQKQTEHELSVRFNFWTKKSTPSTPSSTSPTPQTKSNNSSSVPSVSPGQSVACLHEQIEDLLLALSSAQNRHLGLQQELVLAKMDKLDVEAERDALKLTMLDMRQEPSQAMAYKAAGDSLRHELTKLEHENADLKQQVEELLHQHEMAKDAQSVLVENMLEIKTQSDLLESDKLAIANNCKALQERISHTEKTAEALRQENARLRTAIENAHSDDIHPSTSNGDSQTAVNGVSQGTDRLVELEHLLAAAKLRIAQLETFGSASSNSNSNRSSSCNDHRISLHHSLDSLPTHSRRLSMGNKQPVPMVLSKRPSLYGRFWPSATSVQDTPPISPV